MATEKCKQSKVDEIEAFLRRRDVQYQAVHGEDGKVVALLVGEDAVLDALVEVITVKSTSTTPRKFGEALN